MLLSIIAERKSYNEPNFGLREERGTLDSVYRLKLQYKNGWKRKKPGPSNKVYLMFLNLKVTFACDDREQIKKVMQENKE